MNDSPHPYHRLEHLPVASFVRWRGPADEAGRMRFQPHHPGRLVHAIAELLSLQPGYPGRVSSSGEKDVCVKWALRIHEWEGRTDLPTQESGP
ncbi:DUF1360 domain-containing protein [Paenibacillus sp. TRM 82003]|nr:DUF1360 domain-containing protein [Paenibacillus sp. TRM 82003]